MKEDIFTLTVGTHQIQLYYYNDENIGVDLENKKRPAVIVLPGGAYIVLSDTEGAPVAEAFAERGFAAFVLHYSTMFPDPEHLSGIKNPNTIMPGPLEELSCAVRFLRENAGQFNLDANRITLCGFSAGGNLAGNYSNEWNNPEIITHGGASAESAKPNSVLLCYAATELHAPKAHNSMGKLMYRAVFGKSGYPNPDYEALRKFSPVFHVNANTAPTFLWHSVTDSVLSVGDSIAMFNALLKEKIPCEAHFYTSGDHGAGPATGQPAESWIELAITFLAGLNGEALR